MAKRPALATLWSKYIQTTVSEQTSDQLKELAAESKTTVSGICRVLLQQALESEVLLKQAKQMTQEELEQLDRERKQALRLRKIAYSLAAKEARAVARQERDALKHQGLEAC